MTARIIDGKAVAADLKAHLAKRVKELTAEHGLVPGLAVVLVGEDAASQVYVASKEREAKAAGFHSLAIRLPANTPQEVLLQTVERLNRDDTIHGILVQLPLPDHIDTNAVLLAIDPRKDVDGFHPVNVGLLTLGQPAPVPCTPKGCMKLLETEMNDLSGKRALVIGRSNIVGKPMALLLLAANATVTIAHSRTRNLPDLCREADILVAAIGKPAFVKGEWVKPGSIVLDVGINRLAPDQAHPKGRLVGDVDFESARNVAGAITPVPGGVGPMTIACLLQNTLEAALSDFTKA